MNDHLHIVCLDAPSPPDYGGAIEMYYKIAALSQSGKKIILHYFDYHNDRDVGCLKDICAEIHAYKRGSFINAKMFSLPYIVASRINKALINRLNTDDHPVLLEGLHCTGIIPHLNDTSRVVIRWHNNEEKYYRSLSIAENNLFKKLYFKWESFQIVRYQKKMRKDCPIACLSGTDQQELEKLHLFKKISFVPAFIPWQAITAKVGHGDYGLYHGNLSVIENEAAVEWLLHNVMSQLPQIPFIIAGKGASNHLTKEVLKHTNCRLVIDPSYEELNGLIRNAHVHILPSKNTTGVKIKLLHALFEGRFCITNEKGVAGSQLETHVQIADEPGEMISLIQDLWSKNFTTTDLQQRKQLLQVYNNEVSAKKLNALW